LGQWPPELQEPQMRGRQEPQMPVAEETPGLTPPALTPMALLALRPAEMVQPVAPPAQNYMQPRHRLSR
jgi:hypothetical protein